MAITARPQSPVQPIPLHNRDGTLRSLARQMLADLDPDSLNTTVPTATLAELLTALCDALDRPARPVPAAAAGDLVETTVNPNLRYWVSNAQRAMDEGDEAGAPRPVPPMPG